MLVECGNCGHRWDYTGSKEIGQQTNCPECRYKVDIRPADPADVYAERAPNLPAYELLTVVREEILADELLEDVVAIHVYGSFVRPDVAIDYDEQLNEPTHPADNSDLDVWVEMEGWDDRVLSSRYTGSQHGLVCRLAAQGLVDVHGLEDSELLDVPISGRIDATDAEIETIRRAERTTVSLTDTDQEILGFRPLDFSLGGSDAWEREVGDDPTLTIWNRNVRQSCGVWRNR